MPFNGPVVAVDFFGAKFPFFLLTTISTTCFLQQTKPIIITLMTLRGSRGHESGHLKQLKDELIWIRIAFS